MDQMELGTKEHLAEGDAGLPPSEAAPIERPVTRRRFLGYLAAALTSFIGIATGGPMLGYLAGPLKAKSEANWITLGKVKDFATQVPKLIQFTITRRDGWVEVQEARTAWVVPDQNGQFKVFNGRCTHLGCAYSWQTQGAHANHFFCPCHEGEYDRDGQVLGGPPPRSLDQLEAKVEGDQIQVLYQDFRPGVSQKSPV